MTKITKSVIVVFFVASILTMVVAPCVLPDGCVDAVGSAYAWVGHVVGKRPSSHYYLTRIPVDSLESVGRGPIDSLESVGRPTHWSL